MDEIDTIATQSGVDAFVIGREDLTASMGTAGMKKAVAKIAAAANAARMPMMVQVSSLEDAAALRKIGATAYAISNDQNFLKAAAKSAFDAYCDPEKW